VSRTFYTLHVFEYEECVKRGLEFADLADKEDQRQYAPWSPYRLQGARKINTEAARQAVLEYLKTNGGNVTDAARIFGINRSAVYDIL
jgi:transcriptional regulator of acetoin/glycerol metabolism